MPKKDRERQKRIRERRKRETAVRQEKLLSQAESRDVNGIFFFFLRCEAFD